MGAFKKHHPKPILRPHFNPASKIGLQLQCQHIPLILQKVLGVGTFAAVYKAFGPGGRKFAVKAQALHGILKLVGLTTDKDCVYMILELMEYELFDFIQHRASRRDIISDSETHRIFRGILKGVKYCHDRGVYHRDLKPENILMDSSGSVKVADLGLSTAENPCYDVGCGTEAYLAPEAWNMRLRGRGQGYDPAAADVWALGLILVNIRFQCRLWHKACFSDRHYQAFRADSKRFFDKVFPSFHGELRTLLLRIFDVNPCNRPTVKELIKFFEVGVRMVKENNGRERVARERDTRVEMATKKCSAADHDDTMDRQRDLRGVLGVESIDTRTPRPTECEDSGVEAKRSIAEGKAGRPHASTCGPPGSSKLTQTSQSSSPSGPFRATIPAHPQTVTAAKPVFPPLTATSPLTLQALTQETAAPKPVTTVTHAPIPKQRAQLPKLLLPPHVSPYLQPKPPCDRVPLTPRSPPDNPLSPPDGKRMEMTVPSPMQVKMSLRRLLKVGEKGEAIRDAVQRDQTGKPLRNLAGILQLRSHVFSSNARDLSGRLPVSRQHREPCAHQSRQLLQAAMLSPPAGA